MPNQLLHHAFEIMNIAALVILSLSLLVNYLAKRSTIKAARTRVFPVLYKYVLMAQLSGILFMVTDFLLQSAVGGGSGEIYAYYSGLLLKYADIWLVFFLIAVSAAYFTSITGKEDNTGYSVAGGIVGCLLTSLIFYLLSFILS